MAFYNWQRTKLDRSRRMKKIIFEPLYARYWAGSLAYMYHNLNIQNDSIRQLIILILQMKIPSDGYLRVINYLTQSHTANNC